MPPSAGRKGERKWSDHRAAFPRNTRLRHYHPQLASELLETRWVLNGANAAASTSLDTYSQNPLSFETNVGQTAAQVQFLARGQGYGLYLTPDEALLSLQQSSGNGSSAALPGASPAPAVLSMQLVGANPAAQGAGLDKLTSTTNYLGATPATSFTDIGNYGQVEYQDVYSGINLIYYGNQQQLEFNFVVAPGADPNQVALSFQGTESISIDSAGNLVQHTAGGNVVEQAPVVYQTIDGIKQAVSGAYVMQGANQVGFRVGIYDHSQPLVIDPVVIYATYLGGTGDDYGVGIAVDSSGNTYVTGWTNSLDFPTTAGSLQPTSLYSVPNMIVVGNETYVTKFDPSGKEIASTYVGGQSTTNDAGTTIEIDNSATSIAVDRSGNVYLTGSAGINSAIQPFPTTLVPFPAPPSPSYVGSGTYVVEINAALSEMVYSTYLTGGEGYSIAVDSAGDAFVTGYVNTGNASPDSVDSFDFSFNTPFVAKLDSSGGVVYNEPFAVSGVPSNGSHGDSDIGNLAAGIAVDATGDAYVVGTTDSNTIGTAVPAARTNLGGYDTYVLKVDPQGQQIYLAQVGGSGDDYGKAIAVDAAGDAYVTGTTNSDNFSTLNPYQASNHGDVAHPDAGDEFNAFVYKLNPAGTQLLYSTYLGGSGNSVVGTASYELGGLDGYDTGNGIAIDSAGNAYVVGATDSLDFPTTADAVQPAFGGGFQDAFVTELNANGSGLVYSTFYGGSGSDQSPVSAANSGSEHDVNAYGSAIAVDQGGGIYVTGYTSSAAFPTVNAAQLMFGGGPSELRDAQGPAFEGATVYGSPFDAFVAELSTQSLVLTPMPVQATIGQSFSGVVATFTAPHADDPASDYVASINWGDGSPIDVAAAINQTGNPAAPYQVLGTHTYKTTGDYQVVVAVVDSPDHLQATTGVDASSITGSQSEATVAVNPTKPSNLFVASTYGLGGSGGFGAYSMDGGATWTLVSGGNVGTGAAGDGLDKPIGNFTAAFDQFGNLYITYVALDSNGSSEIAVAWSVDGGQTFQPLASFPGYNSDQPKVTAGPGPTVGTASVLVSFTNDQPSRQVYVAGAVIAGPGLMPTFSAPVAVPGGAGGLTTDVAVGPSGQVVVSWAHLNLPTDPNDGDVYVSLDSQGLSNLSPGAFQQTPSLVPITPSLLGTFIAVPAAPYRGISGVQPWIAFDDSNGPHRGRLYLLYSSSSMPLEGGTSPQPPSNGAGVQDPNAVLSVNLIYSDDNGATFSSVSGLQNNSGGDQLIPSLAVDPITGDVAVAFYGTSAPSDPATQFYTTVSDDGGATFTTPAQVNIGSTNFAGSTNNQYGDYSGIAYYDRELFPAWNDNSPQLEGNPSLPNADVAVARVDVAQVSWPPPVVAPATISSSEGTFFSGTVATFTDEDPALTADDFTGMINWGDGSSSSGTISPSANGNDGFTLSGSHTYVSAGAYIVSATVHDDVNNLDGTSTTDVSRLSGNENDGTIAVDPVDTDRLFAASNEESIGLFVSSSNDGGLTWSGTTIADGGDGLPLGGSQPQVVFDQFGNLYLAYVDQAGDTIVVAMSGDYGQSFTVLDTFFNAGGVSRPLIATGPGPSGAASVWLAFLEGSQLEVTGTDVDSLGVVGVFNPLQTAASASSGDTLNMGGLAVGPAGQVMVSYQTQTVSTGPSAIYAAVDATGLTGSFGPPVLVTQTNVGGADSIPPQQTHTIGTGASLAWDRSGGPNNGRVYLVYVNAAAVGSQTTKIYEVSSDNNGQTWSAPVQASDDTTNSSEFLPSIAVDQTDGDVGVAWYDARNDTNDVTTQFFAAVSSDGGQSFSPNVSVSLGDADATNANLDSFGQQNQYGDYTGLAFVNGILYPLWADNSSELNNNPDPPNFDIAVARPAVAHIADLPLTAEPLDISAEVKDEGSEFTANLATFTDPDSNAQASLYTATIDWGDPDPNTGAADTTTGTITANGEGQFTVSGTHVYMAASEYSITITIKDKGGASATVTTTALVSDAPLEPGGDTTFTAYTGQPLQAIVGTFTDEDPNGAPDDYSTTIDWGDQQQSSGLVTFAGSAALAYDSANNTLYTFGNNDLVANNPPYLMAISLQGVVSPVAPVDGTYYGGLAFDPNNGALYAISNGDNGASTLMSFDFLSQTFSLVAALGNGFTGGLAFDSADGNLYAISGAVGSSWQLDQISPTSGSVTVLGTLAPAGNQPPISYTGLSFYSDGNAYAVGNDSDGNSTLYRLSIGASITVASISQLGNNLTTPPSTQEGFTGGLAYVPTGAGSLLAGSLVGISGDGSGTTYLNTIDVDGTTASVFEVYVAAPPGQTKAASGDFSNGFDIIGTHTYSQLTTAPLTITITDVEPSQVPGSVARSTATDGGTVTVNYPPPEALPAPPAFTAYQGDSTGSLNLATFSVAGGPSSAAGYYSASIDWGDGSTDSGTIAISADAITVSGTHTYQMQGGFQPTVVLHDPTGSSAMVTDSLTVLADVTGKIHAVSSGLIYNPLTRLFNGSVMFTNTGGTTLSGPFPLVFQGLPAGVTLADATGATGGGIPYISDALATLAPGQSSTVEVQFNDPQFSPITYTLQVIDPPLAAANSPTQPEISYGQIPLGFEPNEGQTASQVQYLAQGSGYSLFLTSNDAVLSLDNSASSGTGDAAPSTTQQSVLQMQLVDANQTPTVVGLDEEPGKSNYLLGSDASTWITNVASYAKVEYQQVYPGVDLVYYGNQGQLEYDFIVTPGTDPSVIKFGVQGADTLTLDAQGDLILGTAAGDVVQQAPNIYQEIDGAKEIVAGHYVLLGQNQIGFALGAYDLSRPLVIDPVLVYSTYLEGSTINQGNYPSYLGLNAAVSIAVDASGDAYVTGTTNSLNFPTTPGAAQSSTQILPLAPGLEGSVAFVTKLNTDGTGVVYSTYLGPAIATDLNTVGTSIALDAAGEAYVTGYTDAPGLPAVNAVQPSLGPSAEQGPIQTSTYDAFVAKLNASGSALIFSTYLGGGLNDYGNSIAVDAAGNAYVAGATDSANFPTTAGALQGPHTDGNPDDPPGVQGEGFVAKFSSTGDLIYSTYLGGSSFSAAYGVAVDTTGDAYVTGQTTAPDFQTEHPIQGTLYTDGLTVADAFIAELNPTGSALVYSTYYGGHLDEMGLSIAVDATGSAYVTGYQDLIGGPSGEQPFSSNGNRPDYGFIAKLSPGGATLVYSTSFTDFYQGGDAIDLIPDDYINGFSGQRIAVDSTGNAYVSGVDVFDAAGNAYYHNDPAGVAAGGILDAVVYEFGPSGAVYRTTMLGGSANDTAPIPLNQSFGSGIALDPAGDVYVSGFTSRATGFPTTPGAFEVSGLYSESYEETSAFVLKIAPPAAGVLSVSAIPIHTTEGASFSGVVASFTDSDGDPAGNFTALIDWGDGGTSTGTVAADASGRFNVTGTHTFAEAGFYPIEVAVSDIDGGTASASTTAVTTGPTGDISYPIEIDTSALQGTAGSIDFQFNPGAAPGAQPAVATISDLTVTGGSLTSAVTDVGAASGSFPGAVELVNSSALNEVEQGITFGTSIHFEVTISGSAVEEPNNGDFGSAFAVQILGADGLTPQSTVDPSGAVNKVDVSPDGSTTVTNFASSAQGGLPVAGTPNVADAPLSASGNNLQATAGTLFTGAIATFTDANPDARPDDFATPTIAWGDGQTSTGTITLGSSGAFEVTGTHTYASDGTYAASLTVNDIGGSLATATATVTVAPVAAATVTFEGMGFDVEATTDRPFTGLVASFSDSKSGAAASDFTAVIAWGDGITSTGTVAANGNGGFDVTGTHTYAVADLYPIDVTVNDGLGDVFTLTASGTWTAAAALPEADDLIAAVTGADGRIYEVASRGASINAYDPAANVWTSVTNGFGSVQLGGYAVSEGKDGRIYVLGGYDFLTDSVTGQAEAYDPATDAWSTLAPMPTPVYDAVATTGPDGRIYLLGGTDGTSNQPTTLVEVYDPSNNAWTTASAMPTPLYGAAATAGLDGRIYVFGGYGAGRVEVYNPATNTWSTANLPGAAYFEYAVTTGSDGRIYVLGGADNGGNPVAQAEAYDPASDAWTTLAPMSTTRDSLAAATLPDGRILAVGGVGGSSDNQLGSAEILSDVSGTATVIAGTGTVTSPTVSLIDDSATYSGSPLAYPASDVTVTGAGGLSNSGGTLSYSYNGSPTIPTAAGSYTVVATFTPTDTAEYSIATGMATWTITPATPTVMASNDSTVFNGSPQAYPSSDVTVTGAGGLSNSGGTLSYSYNGSPTIPTAAGSYTVLATFTPTDTLDYSAATGTATWTIEPATLTASGLSGLVGLPFQGYEFSPPTSVPVATFSDGDGSLSEGDFSATINWGDGTTSVGKITSSAGGMPAPQFTITGAHEYQDEGHYTVSVSVDQTAGVAASEATSATAVATATIHEQLLETGTVGTPDENWIQEVYRDVFGRQAEPSGLNFWVAMLDVGQSHDQVAYDIVQLAFPEEFQRDTVVSLYETFLGRMPDPAGQAYWTTDLYDGGTIESMSEALVSSSEYWQVRGGGTVDGFLKALFRDGLGRQIDPAALTYFSGLMANGVSAADVAEAIFNSDEYHRLRVNSFFEQLLNRSADPGAVAYFAGELDGGITDDMVISQILSSNEYYDDVQV
ncbi:MAG TPA: NF038129 family PEP-CTERM protein [Pirellulales bacterium]|nr:NF038129 family PEP-CTERM protein [Pirellulales bacterium]